MISGGTHLINVKSNVFMLMCTREVYKWTPNLFMFIMLVYDYLGGGRCSLTKNIFSQ